MHKDLHKWSTLRFFTDWIRLWPGPSQLPYLRELLAEARCPSSRVPGAQGAMLRPPPPVGAMLQLSVRTHTPHRIRPSGHGSVERGTRAALSNLSVAEVQKQNSPSRRARRYWCQMSEEREFATQSPWQWKSLGLGGKEGSERS